MKKQIVLLVSIFLLVFIFIGACSATNQTANAKSDNIKAVKTPAPTSASNIYVNVNTGNDAWDGTSPTYTGGSVGPKKTIKSGIGSTSTGGNLNVASGTYPENKLTISTNMNIIGASNQNTIVNAGTNNLVFWIKSGTVTIKNLSMTNGKPDSSDFGGNGGAVYNEGTLTIDNCALYNNYATNGSGADGTHDAKAGSNGGAVYNKGTLTITNSNIHDNHSGKGGDASATHHSADGGNGGAIYNGGTLTLQNCTLQNNYCGNGGNSSAFHDGKAGGSGGALYNAGTVKSIENCTFTTNYAGKGGSIQAGTAANGGTGGNGGAIYNNSSLTISDSHFDGNYAGSGADSSDINDAANGGHGGAIYNAATLTITNTEIKSSKAGKGGDCDDAIKIDVMDAGTGGNGGAIYNTKTLTITNCNIHNNKAGAGGDANAAGSDPGNPGYAGAIYNTGTVNITGTKIENNMAGLSGKWWVSSAPAGKGGHGGAIFNTGSLTIQSSTFTGNRAGIAGYISKTSFAYGGSGGAIYNTGSLNISESILSNNHVGKNLQNKSYDGLGGALYNDSTLNVAINFCQLAKNKTQAVYLKTASTSTVNLQNNWWGSNQEPKNEVTGTSTTSSYYTPWLTLTVTANPTSVNVGQTSIVTANLIMNSNGQNTYTTYGKSVPNGISMLFATKSGTIKPTKAVTTNGTASSTFTAGTTTGYAVVYTHCDNQTNVTKIKINPAAYLQITKTVDRNPVKVGDIFVVKVKLENKGLDIAKNVVVKIPINDAFQFISAQFDHGSWSYDEASKTLIWDVGEVKIGVHYFYLTLKALKEGQYFITNTVTSSTYNPNKNNEPLLIYVQPTGNGNTVNAASTGKTVTMQSTGLPIPLFILAFLMVIGGLFGVKRE